MPLSLARVCAHDRSLCVFVYACFHCTLALISSSRKSVPWFRQGAKKGTCSQTFCLFFVFEMLTDLIFLFFFLLSLPCLPINQSINKSTNQRITQSSNQPNVSASCSGDLEKAEAVSAERAARQEDLRARQVSYCPPGPERLPTS